MSNEAFRAVLDGRIRAFVDHWYTDVASADHLLTANPVNELYYKRFTVEIILRLRMKRTIDALTIHYFTKHSPELAKKWAAYTDDEMLHDAMFVKDLERLGMTKAEVYGTQPLFSTKLLQGYFYYGLEHENRPLASLCSSYYIESVSDLTQKAWLTNVEKSLGASAVRGSLAHVAHDEKDDHIDFVWDVLKTFLDTDEDKHIALDHLENVNRLFEMFFKELHDQTIGRTA